MATGRSRFATGRNGPVEFGQVVEIVGKAVDVVGVAVMVVGVCWALVRYATRSLGGSGDGDLYAEARRSVGRSVLLGLEVLVAGDIIRTVAVSPTFTSVGVLAIIVAIRTFLSFTLEMEITSRWPWQARPATARSAG